MTLRTRTAALLLAVMTAFVMLFSDFFVAREAEHDCIGAHCPICEQIAACENTLKQLSNGGVTTAAAFFVMFADAALVLFSDRVNQLDTPVSLKVKLLN